MYALEESYSELAVLCTIGRLQMIGAGYSGLGGSGSSDTAEPVFHYADYPTRPAHATSVGVNY